MASIRKRSVSWTNSNGRVRGASRYEAHFRDRAGQQHRRMFALKKEAQQWLDEQTAGLVVGQWADPQAGKESLAAFAERWRQRQVHAPTTEAAFETSLRNHIYPVLGPVRLDSITSADVQRLVKQWSLTAAPSTVRQRYTVLSIVLRAAVRERVIAVTPCERIKLPKVAPASSLVPISTATVLALRGEIAARYSALITVGAGTGMRRGELLGLTLDRVSFDFATIRVDRQLVRASVGDEVRFASPKTDASVRTIPVADVVLDAIRAHLETFGTHSSGLVFSSAIGTPLRTSTLWTAWRAAARRVGTTATPHDLRHYYASLQIQGGTSIKALQALLGHKSAVETWDTYGHLMGDEDTRSRTVVQSAFEGPAVRGVGTEPIPLRPPNPR
ncbi:site-specific integrase [Nocardioides mangrovicus]|uniref:Site-specific integrase n=1 Tax=Nocardioides mangrovicus TaxID=2478913 RepID=A0A3L8P1N8_9ACTN|nr:site-specific integrase [Nocardioides mangrovicus]RLV49074.1 site-specific integrase [Nocardioides mangrovicus]